MRLIDFRLIFTALLLSSVAIASEEENSPPPSFQEELVIDLKDPIFEQGIIKTSGGGVIEGQSTRIQAQNIEYINRIENGVAVKKVVAETDVFVVFRGKSFVGEKITFDFLTGTGVLEKGKTFVDLWFLGGDKIELKEDGSYLIYDAYMTTCASQENSWEIRSSRVVVNKQKILSAKNIRFNFFRIPLFWLPAFRSNLKFFKDSPIKYKLVWDRGLGPRATMRYRVASWDKFNVFFRLDYRLQRGFGSAIETEYENPVNDTTFITRSYGAFDKIVEEERGPRRYRLQGFFKTQSKEEKTHVYLSYDKLSDVKMVNDFKTDDFVINTEKRSRFLLSHQERDAFATLSVQPRINSFQSVNQELPRLIAGIRPVVLGDTGIISENNVSAGYLDYAYAEFIQEELKNTHALRIETQNQIYRPINLSPFVLTPQLGIVGIFYNNSPFHQSTGQAVFTYGVKTHGKWMGDFSHLRHIIQPYANFEGFTKPRIPVDDYLVFDIQDGYSKLNSLRVGIRNTLFSRRHSFFHAPFTMDTYAIGFFDAFTYKKFFPKVYNVLRWKNPSYEVEAGVCWNIEESVWDYANVQTLITINENVAFGVEMRHRSRFDWRKSDRENFFLDVARPIHELVNSPISDGRNTLLTKCQLRLSPRLTCQFSSHQGWGRKAEPNYVGTRVEITSLLTGNWRMKVGYQHSPNNDRFIFNVFLAN